MPMLIALDDDNTWPQSIVENLRSCTNPQLDQNLHRQILGEVLPHDIVGFHATRLHENHIEELKSGNRSLAPLSPEDEKARVADLVRYGDLSQDEANALLGTTRVHEPCRNGLLGLFFTDKIFETDSCFYFFRYWGGESLGQYGHHENILRRIGIPCVVEVSVPIRFIRNISGKDFANAYSQNHQGVCIDDGMYGYVEDSACSVTVRDIIEFGSERFTEMTMNVEWREQLHP